MRFSYKGELLSDPARLSLSGDLSRLPVAGLRGIVRGHIEVQPTAGAYPEVKLQLALTNLAARTLEFANVAVTSELRWPVLRVQSLHAAFHSDAAIDATGTVNLASRFLSNAAARVTGQLPTNYLPATLTYSNLIV